MNQQISDLDRQRAAIYAEGYADGFREGRKQTMEKAVELIRQFMYMLQETLVLVGKEK